MIYLIYGVETYKKDVKLKNLTKDCSCLYTDELTSEHRSILESNSLFGKNVVVLTVDDLGADDRLLKFCNKPIDGNDLIILARIINKRTKLFETLSKNAMVIECKKLSEEKFVNYILAAMKSLKCQITKAALDELAIRSGYFIDDKITLYKINIYLKQLSFRTETIDIHDVEEVVPKYADEDARELFKFLLAKQDKDLMKLAFELMEKKEQPIKLYGLMLRNLRIALKASMYPEKSVKEIAGLIGLTSYQMRGVSDVLQLPKGQVNSMISALQKGTNDIKEGLMPSALSFIRTIGQMICIRDGVQQ